MTGTPTITLPAFTRSLWSAIRYQARQARYRRREEKRICRETRERGLRAVREQTEAERCRP